MQIVKGFNDGAYIITSDGSIIEPFVGLVLEPSDELVGEFEIEDTTSELSEEDISLQQAIVAGVDPTQVGEDTAAGGQTITGEGPETDGGFNTVVLDRTGKEVNPLAGYKTSTFTNEYDIPPAGISFNILKEEYIFFPLMLL